MFGCTWRLYSPNRDPCSTSTARRPAASSTKRRSTAPVVKSVSGTIRQGAAGESTSSSPASANASRCHARSGRLCSSASPGESPNGAITRPVASTKTLV
jgi:hypothetical protein